MGTVPGLTAERALGRLQQRNSVLTKAGDSGAAGRWPPLSAPSVPPIAANQPEESRLVGVRRGWPRAERLADQ